MIRIVESKLIDGVYYYVGYCVSDDTKPTENICGGSTLTETDTGDVYVYDEANAEWSVWRNDIVEDSTP